MPASRAMASVCRTVLVRAAHGHVEGKGVVEGVAASGCRAGWMSFLTSSTIACPAASNSASRCWVGRQDRAVAGQRQAEGLAQAVHASWR